MGTTGFILTRISRRSYRVSSYAELYTYNRRMFIRDSRRSYKAYSYSKLIIITGLYSFGTPVGVTELTDLILVL